MKEGNFVQRRSKIHKGKQPSAELSEMLRNPDGDVRLANCRNLAVVIYTVDEGTPEYDSEVLKKVKERFSIDIPPSLSINFVHLHEFKYLLGEFWICALCRFFLPTSSRQGQPLHDDY